MKEYTGQLNEYWLKKLFPHASRSTLEANPQICDPQPEQDDPTALGATAQRKEEGMDRVVVRFKGYRVRPLDPDNFAGSVKGLLDGLRHAHRLVGDEPWRIKLETEQEKVKSFKEEKTTIEIIYP